MAADDAGHVLVVGGGPTSTTETFQFHAGSWTQLAAQSTACGRAHHCMVFDSNRGLWTLYGGVPGLGCGLPVGDDTWEFDGTAWTQRTLVTTPGGRIGHGMCFDRARSVTVLFGGSTFGGALTNATWEYDGTNWNQRTPANAPSAREYHAMCYHRGLQSAVLFGGREASGYSNETWLWDGSNWTLVPATGPQPAPRSAAELVFDPIRNVCILAGGRLPSTAYALDTWEFDGAQWTQVSTWNISAPDAYFGMAFDVVDRLVVADGGADVWSIHARTWGATSTAFGSGCAGSNGVVTLQPQGAPRIGQTYQQDLTNLVGPIAIGVLSLQETAPTPLNGFGMPGCTAYLTPEVTTLLLQSGGLGHLDTTIPAMAGLLGTMLLAQGLSIDPTANPAWLVSSNATRGSIGF